VIHNSQTVVRSLDWEGMFAGSPSH
jgi:hypothetical protein